MSVKTFNFSLFFGWLVASIGAVMACQWWGVMGSGLLFVALTMIVARLAGVRGD